MGVAAVVVVAVLVACVAATPVVIKFESVHVKKYM